MLQNYQQNTTLSSIEAPSFSDISASSDVDADNISKAPHQLSTDHDECCPIMPNTLIESSNVPHDDSQMDTCVSVASNWDGFKLVGDNIDYHIKPRFMTTDRQSSSVHCFNSVAIKDRINFSSYSNDLLTSPLPPNEATADIILPSTGDDTEMMKNFLFLIKRIICKHVTFFSKKLWRHSRYTFESQVFK